MPQISPENRDLWLWMLNDGRALTAREIAQLTGKNPEKVFWQLSQMSQSRRQLVEIMPAKPGDRRYRYAVTGTCRVPVGLCVAEVQAEA